MTKKKFRYNIFEILLIIAGYVTLVLILILPKSNISVKSSQICMEFTPIVNTSSIAILTYHHILADEEIAQYGFEGNKWTMPTSHFEEQLAYLKENGYQTITLNEFYNWYHGTMYVPEKTVVITFDDGYKSTARYAVPLLKKYGFTASNFIIGKTIQGMYMDWDPSILEYVCQLDLHDTTITKYLQFYSHTYDGHGNPEGKPAYLTYSKDQIIEDLKKSSEINSIKFLAYPFGASNADTWAAVQEAGVQMAFNYGNHKHADKDDPLMNIPRYSVDPSMSLQDFIAILTNE